MHPTSFWREYSVPGSQSHMAPPPIWLVQFGHVALNPSLAHSSMSENEHHCSCRLIAHGTKVGNISRFRNGTCTVLTISAVYTLPELGTGAAVPYSRTRIWCAHSTITARIGITWSGWKQNVQNIKLRIAKRQCTKCATSLKFRINVYLFGAIKTSVG